MQTGVLDELYADDMAENAKTERKMQDFHKRLTTTISTTTISTKKLKPCTCLYIESRTVNQSLLLPNLLYAELLSIFDCLTNLVRSGFDELFPVTTFLTVSQSHDTLASMFLYIT